MAGVTFEKKGNVAIIKLNKPKKLNAMSSDDWFQIACHMYEVAAMDDITITVLAGEGRFFSSYVYILGLRYASCRESSLRSCDIAVPMSPSHAKHLVKTAQRTHARAYSTLAFRTTSTSRTPSIPTQRSSLSLSTVHALVSLLHLPLTPTSFTPHHTHSSSRHSPAWVS